jgi:hypothetical protein
MNGHPHLIMVAEIPSSRNRAREARRTHSNTSAAMPMSPVALGIRPGRTLGLRHTLAIPYVCVDGEGTSTSQARTAPWSSQPSLPGSAPSRSFRPASPARGWVFSVPMEGQPAAGATG